MCSSARLHSPAELELLVSDSVEGGLLDASEEEIIRNIFDFGARQVHQVMTPRPRVEAVAHDTPLPDLLKQMVESKYSRLPVYEEDLDRDSNVLEVLIGRLRRKLDPDKTLNPIETLRGRGYRLSLARSH